MKTRFKWDKKDKEKFVNKLKESQNEIEEISQRLDAHLIESTGKKIQELYFNAAKHSLEEKHNSQKNWEKRKT